MAESFWLGMAIVFMSGTINGSFPLPMKCSRQWAWELPMSGRALRPKLASSLLRP